jgi:hypothetical protein
LQFYRIDFLSQPFGFFSFIFYLNQLLPKFKKKATPPKKPKFLFCI